MILKIKLNMRVMYFIREIKYFMEQRRSMKTGNMIDKLIFYFQYSFVRYALIVGVLIALCSSLLGATIVAVDIVAFCECSLIGKISGRV